MQIPDAAAPQSARFSPWLVYDPFNIATVGPRLLKQNALVPRVFHVFGSEAVGSGNQLMVALQHFTNDQVVRPARDMEMHWVRVLTSHRHLEINASFAPPALETTFVHEPEPPTSVPRVLGGMLTCPIRVPMLRVPSVPRLNDAKRNGSKLIHMISQLPQEVVLKIYSLLTNDMSPMFRSIIPDVWWNTPKQSIYYMCGKCLFDSYLYLKRPVDGLTNEHGVLHSPYQTELLAFFREISFSVDDWSAPFDEWPSSALPRSRTFILPGQLFLVQFIFRHTVPRGFSLTIQPSPYVFRLHDLDRDLFTDRFGLFVPVH